MSGFAFFRHGVRKHRHLFEIAAALSLAVLQWGCQGSPESVLTYKYDTYRTGFNNVEATLIASKFPASFGLQRTISLDDQVDTQPLVVPGLTTVGGHATNGDDVVYVTTENNSVYAIDGATGAILAQTNLGTPVSSPLGCGNNGPNVGIDGTGVIDQPSNTFYVIAYTNEGGVPTYRIHALDITTLADKITPAPVIKASHALSGGKTFNFNASVQRQRPALLEANGNIYAAFGSFCDYSASKSRGWVLGWKVGSLTPLAANGVPNTLPPSSSGFFLSSIWMSGSGLATDANSNIIAVVGNSSGGSYDGSAGTNYSESVIQLSPDLSAVTDYFTPTNVTSELDAHDLDFGSGGVLVLPGRWSANYLEAAAGKDGNMYVLNQSNLGHGPPSGPSPAPLATEFIGYCWCDESYFFGNNGPVIVSSGGGNPQIPPPQNVVPDIVQLWGVNQSGPLLTNLGKSTDLGGTGQDGGFFTSVSGLGSDAVIWAVTRPDSSKTMHLYAFTQQISGGVLKEIVSGLPAGNWPNTGGNANIVPVVANGRVYVATNQQLAVFGP